MRGARFFLVALVTTLLVPALSSAQTPGEIWVKLVGSDYCKPFLDGAEYEAHDFENNGYKLVIRVDDIETEHTFEMRPSNDALGPVSVTTVAKKFKPKRIRGERARRMVMPYTAKFVKRPPPPPPAPKKPAAPPKAPEKPATPEKPEKPATPEKPAAPEKPAKPATPEKATPSKAN